METAFQISLHVKTPTGFKTYGTFDLCHDEEKAKNIFRQLQGNEDVSETTMLYLDFVKVQDGIPLPLQILHCSLEEVAANVKIITRETFKNLSLENGELGL